MGDRWVKETDALARLERAWDQPSGVERERLLRFSELLIEWNAHINLTGARSVLQVIEDHLPDAFALAALVSPEATVVDVGSGGGLPGLPFGVLRPDCQVVLVEPRAKRVAFLRTAVRELQAPRVSVDPRRVEAVGQFPGPVVACSRATFPPNEWLVTGSRLAPEGLVVVFATAPIGGRPARSTEYRTLAGVRRWMGVFLASDVSALPSAALTEDRSR